MAHVISAPAGSGLTARLRRTVEGVFAAWAQHREFQSTYNQLDALSDRDLADIGVRRSDIADIARLHVYGQ